MVKVIKKQRSILKSVLLTIVGVFVVLFVIIPLLLTTFDGSSIGNVALIPISGIILGEDGSGFVGEGIASSTDIVGFIEEADLAQHVKAIVLEINSPGGSAVASDEIAAAVKKANKPVVTLIREVGASGGYWVASASEHIVANRMSITGSIGVISSYLEFSGLMDDYGVGYERLVAGERKDIGTPFKKLSESERDLLQDKLDRIHGFFIEEVAMNRGLSTGEVQEIATGEFYLGVEALELGLVDALGDKETVEQYLLDTYGIEEITYALYEREYGFFDLIGGVLSHAFFSLGKGIGNGMVQTESLHTKSPVVRLY